MKERIKKFYEEHEALIAVGSIVTGTIAAGVAVYLFIENKGHHVDGVFSGNDVAKGSTVFVTLKNGSVLPYTKPEA